MDKYLHKVREQVWKRKFSVNRAVHPTITPLVFGRNDKYTKLFGRAEGTGKEGKRG